MTTPNTEQRNDAVRLTDAELEAGLTSVGIFVYGPDAERFEKMFTAAMEFRALSQPPAPSPLEGEVRVLPGANSHVFDMRLVIGKGDEIERGDSGECIAFADEPWASRIAAALCTEAGSGEKLL